MIEHPSTTRCVAQQKQGDLPFLLLEVRRKRRMYEKERKRWVLMLWKREKETILNYMLQYVMGYCVSMCLRDAMQIMRCNLQFTRFETKFTRQPAHLVRSPASTPRSNV